MSKWYFSLPVVAFLSFATACTFDQLEPVQEPDICNSITPTYSVDVKPIIDSKCAISGCHVSGFPTGDFSTFEGMSSRLESGLVNKRVIEFKDMPPPQSYGSGPTPLTTAEREIFKCWLADGHPEQ